jgi:hypothetical protein
MNFKLHPFHLPEAECTSITQKLTENTKNCAAKACEVHLVYLIPMVDIVL